MGGLSRAAFSRKYRRNLSTEGSGLPILVAVNRAEEAACKTPQLTCFRCLETKPRAAFPVGRPKKSRAKKAKWARISSVCMQCIEIEAWERDAARIANSRETTYRAESGRWRRKCATCRVEKDLRSFHKSKCEPHGRSYECKVCANKRTRDLVKRKGVSEKQRAAQRECARKRRARPEVKAREREKAARRYAELKADPVAHAKFLEEQRIAYRIRRERQGKPVTRNLKAKRVPEVKVPIPSKPLAEFLEGMMKERTTCANIIGENGIGYDSVDVSWTGLSREVNVPERTIRRWREQHPEGLHVRIGTLEQVLMSIGVDAVDIYNPHDYPEVSALFDSA